MTPIFYLVSGAALYMLGEELVHNFLYHRRERKLREMLDARHKENGLAIILEISEPIDKPLQ